MKKASESGNFRFKIVILVMLLLIMFFTAFWVYKNRQVAYSPEKEYLCEERVWCLDYDTIAEQKGDCAVTTVDCNSGEKCSRGLCG